MLKLHGFPVSNCTNMVELPLLEKLGENPHVKAIAAKRDAAMPGFVAAMRTRLQGGR
jgi:hypothetical protein